MSGVCSKINSNNFILRICASIYDNIIGNCTKKLSILEIILDGVIWIVLSLVQVDSILDEEPRQIKDGVTLGDHSVLCVHAPVQAEPGIGFSNSLSSVTQAGSHINLSGLFCTLVLHNVLYRCTVPVVIVLTSTCSVLCTVLYTLQVYRTCCKCSHLSFTELFCTPVLYRSIYRCTEPVVNVLTST